MKKLSTFFVLTLVTGLAFSAFAGEIKMTDAQCVALKQIIDASQCSSKNYLVRYPVRQDANEEEIKQIKQKEEQENKKLQEEAKRFCDPIETTRLKSIKLFEDHDCYARVYQSLDMTTGASSKPVFDAPKTLFRTLPQPIINQMMQSFDPYH